MYTPSLSIRPIDHTPKSYAYNVNNNACAHAHTHTHTRTHARTHARTHVRKRMCAFTYMHTHNSSHYATFTGFVPKMSSCDGGQLMLHVYTTFTSDSALSVFFFFFFVLFSFLSFFSTFFRSSPLPILLILYWVV